MAAFTLDHAEDVMRRIAAGRAPATRARLAQLRAQGESSADEAERRRTALTGHGRRVTGIARVPA